MAQASIAPSVPASPSVSGKASESFKALKQSLSGIASWEMSPNTWDKIQLIYTSQGNEVQAKGFLFALQLPMPEM